MAPRASRKRRRSARRAKERADHPRRSVRFRREDLCRSFGKDPAFYDFYRAMQSYDATFAQKGSTSSCCRRTTNI
jgi:hypothetical protein